MSNQPASSTSQQHSAGDAAEHRSQSVGERVSLMTGDRICIGCTYNLIGQPIMREPHYNLLIVRCPECGRATPVQEYPLLGKWAGRLGTALAGLWLLLIVALLGGTSLMIFGLSMGGSELAAQDYWQYLNNQHTNWRNANPTLSPQALTFESWFVAQDSAQLLADAGGIPGALSAQFLIPMLVMMFLAPVVGAMWSVIFIARRWLGLTLWAGVMWLGALAISVAMILDVHAAGPIWAHRAASIQIGTYALPVFVTIGTVFLIVGMLIGRPIARGLVKVMLPPRMWCRMAWLWTACGRQPPGPGTGTGTGNMSRRQAL